MNYLKVGLSALLATAAAFACVSCGQGETSLTSSHAEDTSGAPGENTASETAAEETLPSPATFSFSWKVFSKRSG